MYYNCMYHKGILVKGLLYPVHLRPRTGDQYLYINSKVYQLVHLGSEQRPDL